MKPNPGFQPDDTRGKRVAVELANGSRPNPDYNGPGYPRGWSADGSRWSRGKAPHDIAFYEVL